MSIHKVTAAFVALSHRKHVNELLCGITNTLMIDQGGNMKYKDHIIFQLGENCNLGW